MLLEGPGWVDLASYPGVDPHGNADSTAALQRALDYASTDYASQRAILRPGTYLVTAPLIIPPAMRLEGTMGMLGADPTTTFSQCIIKALPSFKGDALLSIRDAHLGGYPKQSGNQQISHLMLDGSDSPPNVDGIRLTGPVQGVQVEDPYYTGQQAPYNMRALRVRVHYAARSGVSITSVTDSTWMDVHAIGCSYGWSISAGANSRYIGCRAEGSANHGYNVTRTGAGPGSGGITFVGCSTDGNTYSGFMFSGGGNAPVIVSGCMSRGDAASGGDANAGLRVSGAAYPVLVGEFSIYPVDRRVATPRIGVLIHNSPTYVGLSNALIHAGDTPLSWDRSGVLSIRNVASRTGPTYGPSSIIVEAETR
jgi:hypothetical protein